MIVGILKILKKRSRIVAFFSRKCPYRTHVLDAIATPEAGCSAPGFTHKEKEALFLCFGAILSAHLHLELRFASTCTLAYLQPRSGRMRDGYLSAENSFFCVLVASDR